MNRKQRMKNRTTSGFLRLRIRPAFISYSKALEWLNATMQHEAVALLSNQLPDPGKLITFTIPLENHEDHQYRKAEDRSTNP